MIVKAVVAFLFLFLLLSFGFRGRQHARVQAKLEDITVIRDQLQQKLEDGQRPAENFEAGTMASALKARLGEFESDHPPGQLSAAENLELRLCKATLANAEQRFAEALAMVTEADEKASRARASGQADRLIRILLVRGDSFCGRREWKEALKCYQEALTLKPNRPAALAHAADCQFALGKTNEALGALEAAAKLRNQQGGAALAKGQTNSALLHYAKAVEILTRLTEQHGRGDLAGALAKSHGHRGDAFLVLGKPDAALAHYAKALEILTRLAERSGGSDLAASHTAVGNALLSQQKFDAIIAHYDQAIEIQSRLVAPEGRGELAVDLALTHNNRGVIRRAQGKPGAALADFDAAIKILKMLLDQPEAVQTNGGATRLVKVDVIIGFSEKDVDVQTRPRTGPAGRKELAVILGMVFKNRGHAHTAHGKPEGAIADFKQAAEIFTRLVEQEGQEDLTLQLAMSLSPLAWIQATSPDPAFRDGGKAREHALKACALSTTFGPLQSLAAACAETGNYAEAVKWQQTALQLAPREDQAEARSRLGLYQSGKPYRTPPPKAG